MSTRFVTQMRAPVFVVHEMRQGEGDRKFRWLSCTVWRRGNEHRKGLVWYAQGGEWSSGDTGQGEGDDKFIRMLSCFVQPIVWD